MYREREKRYNNRWIIDRETEREQEWGKADTKTLYRNWEETEKDKADHRRSMREGDEKMQDGHEKHTWLRRQNLVKRHEMMFSNDEGFRKRR